MLVSFFLLELYPLLRAGESDFDTFDLRGLRTNWLIVGISMVSSFPR